MARFEISDPGACSNAGAAASSLLRPLPAWVVRRAFSAYVTSKHAVIGMMRSAALECAPINIRVNTVNPSPVETRMMRSLEAGLMRSGRRVGGKESDQKPDSDAALRHARRHREIDAVPRERRQRSSSPDRSTWRTAEARRGRHDAQRIDDNEPLALPDRRPGKVRDIYSVTLSNGEPAF